MQSIKSREKTDIIVDPASAWYGLKKLDFTSVTKRKSIGQLYSTQFYALQRPCIFTMSSTVLGL